MISREDNMVDKHGIRMQVFTLIEEERKKQDAKWGDQSGHPDWLWQLILTEEVGEVSEAILKAEWEDGDPDRLKEELIQVAAVTVAWLEGIEYEETADHLLWKKQ